MIKNKKTAARAQSCGQYHKINYKSLTAIISDNFSLHTTNKP